MSQSVNLISALILTLVVILQITINAKNINQNHTLNTSIRSKRDCAGCSKGDSNGQNQNQEKYPTPIIWTQEVILHEDRNFTLRWFTGEDFTITFEMSGKSRGYLAIGFSRTKTMQRSDIVMAWMDPRGNPKIKDLYAIKNEKPLVDEENNYQLLNGAEDDGVMTFRFKRQWDTCSEPAEQDYTIYEFPIPIIWAISDDRPKAKGLKLKASYHGVLRGVLPRVFLTKSIKYDAHRQCTFGKRLKLPLD